MNQTATWENVATGNRVPQHWLMNALSEIKMDVRIRNSEWESDGDLKRELSKYVTKGLQRNEISSYMLRDFPQYSWSIKTLDRRMRYFNIFYHNNNVSLNAVKEAVKGDLNGPGKLLGYRAMHLKIRQQNGLNVTRDER